jgi:thymidylate kinase
VGRRTRGRLIALDGNGATLSAAAKDVVRVLASASIPRGVSQWDASGIFTELAAAEADVRPPSARTLTLLYAADLAFRLRWQIVPALEEGRSVIAAPYVETAKALALAAGVHRKWLDELFRFAPKADATYHVNGRGARAASTVAGKGYVDCFSTALMSGDVPVDMAELRKRSLDYLAALEKRRRCLRLTAAALAKVAR